MELCNGATVTSPTTGDRPEEIGKWLMAISGAILVKLSLVSVTNKWLFKYESSLKIQEKN